MSELERELVEAYEGWSKLSGELIGEARRYVGSDQHATGFEHGVDVAGIRIAAVLGEDADPFRR